jgi:hypothetical protein
LNKLSGLPLIIKFTVGFAILGMVNALIGMAVTVYQTTRIPVDVSALHTWDNIVILIWPTSLMLAPATRTTPGTVFTAIVSVIANGYIYGLLGLVVGAIRHRYKVDTYGAPPTGLKAPARRDAKRALLWAGVISVITNFLAVPWYIPAYRRTGTAFDWRATLYDTMVLWIVFWVVIFLPLFLQSGLRARRRTGGVTSNGDEESGGQDD